MAVYKKRGNGIKRVARNIKKAVGKAIKKRYYPKGQVKYGTIYKDVMMLKKMVNAEKKSISVNLNNQVFGQVLGNSAGYHSNDITPIPVQGSGSSQRNGNSIKICSWHMTAQIIQQANAVGETNYKMYMFHIKGNPLASPGTFVSEYWGNNNFVGGGGQIVDYNSQITPTEFNNARLLYFRSFKIKPDSISGQTGFRTINIGGKLQHHVRYNGDLNTLNSGQIYLVVLADSGNCSPTVVSTLSNIPQSAVNTGCTMNYHLRWYYYDN